MSSSRNGSAGPIAWVVPRYGPDIVGGAESLCRTTAESLAGAGHEVEVFTTCATDHFTWRNEVPAGSSVEKGVTVHRFPVDESRDNTTFFEMHHAIARRVRVDYLGQVLWASHSVASAPMERELHRRADLRCMIAMPYLFGTTFWCVENEPERTVLNPCLHDEPHAWVDLTASMLNAAVGCISNTAAEERLLARIAPGARSRVGGIGFDTYDEPADVAGFCADREIAPGYLLYAGRREEAKGVGTLFAHYRRFCAARPDAPPLALMGSGGLMIPDDLADRIIDLGFVPAADKRAAYAGALCLVHPSQMESFGIVLMEAWQEGTPALVNAHSEVLSDHCRESGGGLWFADYPEFAEALSMLIEDGATTRALGRRGRDYVASRYSHAAVRDRYLEALDAWL